MTQLCAGLDVLTIYVWYFYITHPLNVHLYFNYICVHFKPTNLSPSSNPLISNSNAALNHLTSLFLQTLPCLQQARCSPMSLLTPEKLSGLPTTPVAASPLFPLPGFGSALGEVDAFSL